MIDHFGFDHKELFVFLWADYKFQVWIYETQYNKESGEEFKDYIGNLGVVGMRILAYQFTIKYNINPAKIGSNFWHVAMKKFISLFLGGCGESFFVSSGEENGSTITIDSYIMSCIERSGSYFVQMISPSFKQITQVDAFISENRFDEEGWGKVDKTGNFYRHSAEPMLMQNG